MNDAKDKGSRSLPPSSAARREGPAADDTGRISKADRQKAFDSVEPGWKEQFSADEVRSREYRTYQQYLDHQAFKLQFLDLDDYDRKYRDALIDRLRKSGMVSRGTSVLCLGARTGAECKALIELGCFPVGVDINPGTDNAHVVKGDFHALAFAEASVDAVFTNALDHAFDLDRVLREVERVLKPGGLFIAEIVAGSLDPHGREPGQFESIWWNRLAIVVAKIRQRGFELIEQTTFEFPWGGDLAVFRKP